MKYKEPLTYSHNDIENIEKSNDVNKISKMLVGIAFNETDPDFAFQICEKYSNSDNFFLVGAALESIAHIARVHRYLPKSRLIVIYSKYMNVDNDDIQWGMEILKDDIKVFIPDLYQMIEQIKK